MKIDKKYVLNTKAYSKMLKKNNEKIELYRKKIDDLEKQNKLYKDNSEAKCYNCKYRQSRFYTGGWDDVSAGMCELPNEDGRLDKLVEAGLLVKHTNGNSFEYFPVKSSNKRNHDCMYPACIFYEKAQSSLTWADR